VTFGRFGKTFAATDRPKTPTPEMLDWRLFPPHPLLTPHEYAVAIPRNFWARVPTDIFLPQSQRTPSQNRFFMTLCELCVSAVRCGPSPGMRSDPPQFLDTCSNGHFLTAESQRTPSQNRFFVTLCELRLSGEMWAITRNALRSPAISGYLFQRTFSYRRVAENAESKSLFYDPLRALRLGGEMWAITRNALRSPARFCLKL